MQSQRAPLRNVCFFPGNSDCMASCSGANNGSIAIWELAETPQVRCYITESRKLAGVQVRRRGNAAPAGPACDRELSVAVHQSAVPKSVDNTAGWFSAVVFAGLGIG